jgi:ClpX C4-type zinc finger
MTTEPVCSFCGLPQDNDRKIIGGPGAAICNACVSLSVQAFEESGIPLPPVERVDQRQVGDWQATVVAVAPDEADRG